MTEFSQPAHVRSALFVDFDNIYLGLQNEDPRAAEQFATHPGRWLRWLQEELPLDARMGRKILSRRCYLNPSQFSRFRPYFIRSAFEVVDCPPLTRGGKTSADIQMVMDIMDALGHVTRFDEFMILSGDADFTPVLLRLSRHDRRSVVLAAGPASAAYKAACDLLIDQDTFLEEAIGIGEGSPVRPGADSELLQRIAAKVHERAAAEGELVATDLPGIFREFAEFTPDSNWLGFYSLRGMTSAVVHARRDLEMLEGDPWRVRVATVVADAAGEGGDPLFGQGGTAAGSAFGPGAAAPAGAGVAGPGRPEGSTAGSGFGAGGAAAGGNGGLAPGSAGSAGHASSAGGAAAAAGSAAGPAPLIGSASPQLLRAIADRVHGRISTTGELLATDLPGIYRDFPQFTPNSNWLGFYSLRGLSDAVIRSRGDLEMADGDPWRVRLRPLPPGTEEPPAAAGPTATGAAAGPGADTGAAAAPTGTAGPNAADPSNADPNAAGQAAAAPGARTSPGAPGSSEAPGSSGAPDDPGAPGAAAATGAGAPSAARTARAGDPTGAADPPAGEDGDPAPAEAPSAADLERQRQTDAVVELVRGLVASSDSPLPMARAAHAALDRFGETLAGSRWLGAGTFRDLLATRTDLGFAVSATRPGYLYDPDRHQTPLDHSADMEIGDPELTSLAHRIHRITDTPYLAPDEYALVFREIAEEVNEEGYFLTRTSKAVRDRCIEEGTPVARTSVNFILRGITSAGYRFAAGNGTQPRDLASAFVKNVLGLCESAGMPLSDEEREQLSTWIAGGLDQPP